jgi:4-diphosphocytidyl-2C-methyl-D-erythritol kinase
LDYLEIEAHAKVNLTLDITGKRSDGYHELKNHHAFRVPCPMKSF